MTPLALDDVLVEIGTFGWFQLRQFLLMILPLVFNAFSNLSYVFTAADLKYRCYIPECENRSDAAYLTEWLPAAVPFDRNQPAGCERYEAFVNITSDYLQCQASDFNHSAITRCFDFVYEDKAATTIVNEFNLTCDENTWKITLVGTIHSVAQALALLLGGLFSDRYGRKWALLLCIGMGSTLGVVRSFSVNYEMFLVLEFLEPLLGSTMYTTAFILGQELVGPKQRVFAKSLCLVVFALGEATMGVIAMFVHNWRHYLLALFVPGLVSLSFLWVTAESVRWLLSKGRNKEAIVILEKAARTNRRTLSDSTLKYFATNDYQRESPQLPTNPSFFAQLAEVFRYRRLTIRLAICSFCWFTNVMVYYGLTLNSVTLAGDKNVNFILITLVEIPGAVCMNFILNRFPRRMTQFVSLAVCGVLCLVTLAIPEDDSWIHTAMFLFSKMAISFSFGVLYIYTAEIFPTNLRQSLLSMCSMIGRLGSIVAPQMPLLAKVWKPLPMTLFGSIALLSAFTILEFPETGNVRLPNTASEAENLKQNSFDNLDGVLQEIGQFGRFQVRQYGLMVLPIIFNALFTLSYIFTAGNLEYRCLVPECEDPGTDVYSPDWLNESIGLHSYGRCERFQFIPNITLADWEECSSGNFNYSAVIPCDRFVFKTEETTIVRDFNITCAQNDWKLTMVGTMNNVGQFVALPIAGYLSDRFGRRWILLVSVAGSALFGLLRSFATSYEMFIAMEFLDPVIGSTMYTTAFILALELVGPKMRVTGNNIISCAFSFGEALLGLLAMYFRDWRVLLRILYIPGFLSLPFLYTTVESVRWLLSKNRKDEAFKTLKRAAKINGKTLSQAALARFNSIDVKSGSTKSLVSQSYAQLLREALGNPGLVLRVINCSFCWLTNTMVYFGLSLNSVSLSGNKYLNFILVSLIELPGFFLMQLILDRVGRKKTLFTTLILGGLFCIISVFIAGVDAPALHLTLFLLSKLSITMSFGTLYIYTVEIFPTNLRQSLLSTCSMFGRIGSMIAPQTPLLAKIWTPLPMILFGCLGISSAIASLQFPETLNNELPNTLEEAMNMQGNNIPSNDR
uniref:Major facilitator superfamily (MFS) profile domain-containing protein n=1 Tax=Anopheles epiroticus TaxID=199890 RepID=A0A182PKB6_9DIPT